MDHTVFRVTRNSDLTIDEDEAEDLLQTIEETLRQRMRGEAVRLEILADGDERFVADAHGRAGPERAGRLPRRRARSISPP